MQRRHDSAVAVLWEAPIRWVYDEQVEQVEDEDETSWFPRCTVESIPAPVS